MKWLPRCKGVVSGPQPDYPALGASAESLRRSARCLSSMIGEARPPGTAAVETTDAMVSADVPHLLKQITESVERFKTSGIALSAKSIDLNVLAGAHVQLERIRALSQELKKRAEQAAGLSNRTIDHPSGAKPHYRKLLGLHLSADCDTWDAKRFSSQPAELKNGGSIKIEGVEVKVKHHKLVTSQTLPLEECMPCTYDDKAIADGEHYVVRLRDFDSYQVNERTFAYQAVYEVARSRNDRITFRADQPLVIYYVDYVGQGEFELAETGKQLVPEWVRAMMVTKPKRE